jgi:RNA polymerase sigma-70 factor (ECF subfamily)
VTRRRDEFEPAASSSDGVLWTRAGHGDAEAFEQLYRSHVGAVSRYLTRRVPVAEVDDLVAAVFLEAWRQRDRVVVDPAKGLLPWLLGVARNLSRAHYRQANERPLPTDAVADERGRPLHEASLELGDAAILFEQRDEHELLVACARAALASLSDDDQLMIDLVVIEGRSPAEAARMIGINPVAARSRLHRSRSRLAAAFARRVAEGVDDDTPSIVSGRSSR